METIKNTITRQIKYIILYSTWYIIIATKEMKKTNRKIYNNPNY